MHLYYLQPLLLLLLFPLSNIVLSIVSIWKPKIDYDAQKNIEGISIL
jgi:hypothetical protein